MIKTYFYVAQVSSFNGCSLSGGDLMIDPDIEACHELRCPALFAMDFNCPLLWICPKYINCKEPDVQYLQQNFCRVDLMSKSLKQFFLLLQKKEKKISSIVGVCDKPPNSKFSIWTTNIVLSDQK